MNIILRTEKNTLNASDIFMQITQYTLILTSKDYIEEKNKRGTLKLQINSKSLKAIEIIGPRIY